MSPHKRRTKDITKFPYNITQLMVDGELYVQVLGGAHKEGKRFLYLFSCTFYLRIGQTLDIVPGATILGSEDDLVNGIYALGKTKDENVQFSGVIYTTAFMEK